MLVLTDRDVATSIDQLLTLVTDSETDRHKDRRKSCIYTPVWSLVILLLLLHVATSTRKQMWMCIACKL
jgi:hypothetical protein